MSTTEIRGIALEHFRAKTDIEQIFIVLQWLIIKGYDIDTKHKFGGREFDCFGDVKNLSVNGMNVQGYCTNNEGFIEVFNFYTKDGSCYHIDTDYWASIALSEIVTTDRIDEVVKKLN